MGIEIWTFSLPHQSLSHIQKYVIATYLDQTFLIFGNSVLEAL